MVFQETAFVASPSQPASPPFRAGSACRSQLASVDMKILISRRRIMTGTAMAVLVAVTASAAAAAWGDRQPAQAATPAVGQFCPVPGDPQSVARAATGYALLDGIAGDAKKPAQRNEFLVTGVRFGVNAGAPDLCQRSGPRDLTTELLVVDKPVDKASIGLLKAATEGARLAQLRIRLVGANPKDPGFLVWTFGDLQARSVRQVYTAKGLSERVAFTFDHASVRYGTSEVQFTAYPPIPLPTPGP
jgi:type VI protein secretion system component Hcp